MRAYTYMSYDGGGSDGLTALALSHAFGKGVAFTRVEGKPLLIPEGSGYISISHSGSNLIIVISCAPVGTDVEIISSKRNYAAISKRMGWGADVSASEFYRRWTAYEARFKCGAENASVSYYSVFKDAVTAVAATYPSEKVEFYPLEQLI